MITADTLYKTAKEELHTLMQQQKGYCVINLSTAQTVNELIREFPMIYIEVQNVIGYAKSIIYVCKAEYIGDIQ